MVLSAPAQPSPPLPTLEEALGQIPSSLFANTIVHVSFQVVGPGCTPAPVFVDLEASRTIFQAKVALACLLSAAVPTTSAAEGRPELHHVPTPPDDPPSRATPVRAGGIAPGQLQLVHAGSIVGDHVRLCELKGMTGPGLGAPTRDWVRPLPARPCLRGLATCGRAARAPPLRTTQPGLTRIPCT
jgi:hypothetical protein